MSIFFFEIDQCLETRFKGSSFGAFVAGSSHFGRETTFIAVIIGSLFKVSQICHSAGTMRGDVLLTTPTFPFRGIRVARFAEKHNETVLAQPAFAGL